MEKILFLISVLWVILLFQANAATVTWDSASVRASKVETGSADLQVPKNMVNGLTSERSRDAIMADSSAVLDWMQNAIINEAAPNIFSNFDPLSHILKYSDFLTAGDSRLRLIKNSRSSSLYQLRTKTPVPAAFWLFGSALMGLSCSTRRKLH